MVFVTSGDGASGSVKLQAQDGKVVVEADADPDRPWLGVLLDDSGAMGEEQRSLAVLSVADGSPAARGGMQRGDIIVGIDGQALARRGEQGLLGGHGPGDRVKIQITRDGKPMDLSLQLAGRPGRVEFNDAEGINAFSIAGDSFEGLAGLEALRSFKDLPCLPCPEGAKCPTTGFMFRVGSPPRLGVMVEAMSDQLAKFFGAEPGHGVLVQEVIKDSAAEAAGIEAGDIILRVGETDIESAGDIHDALDDLKKGGEVEVEVLRRGARRNLRATIAEPPRRGAFSAVPAPPAPPAMPRMRQPGRERAGSVSSGTTAYGSAEPATPPAPARARGMQDEDAAAGGVYLAQ
jgi:predicted metalloprotease with PDZ domain